MIPTKPYLDGFYQCPYTSDSSYYQFILSICERENTDFILPSFDADQNLFYDGNPDLDRLGIKSLGISTDLIDIYRTKENTNRFLESKGLPTPVMYKKSDIVKERNYFCKPRTGVGSIGARMMKGTEILNSNESDLIIEEICTGPEVTLECFNYAGKVYSIARERLDTKSGVCTKTRVYYDASLESIAQKFSAIIKLPYIFNLQFMTNSRGEKVITDVNLRTAGGMSLSYAAGWDEVEAIGKIMLGEEGVEITVNVPIKEQYVIRAYTDIVTKKINKRIAFDLDGTLLDSKERHRVVMDDVLKEFSITINTEDLVKDKSSGLNNISWLIGKGCDPNIATQIQNKWIELIEQDNYLELDVLYDGVLTYLKKLSLTNELFLITARNNKRGVLNQINKLGLGQFFDDIMIVESDANTFIYKADYLKIKGISLMIGDTEVDYKASCKANCHFMAAMEGFRSSEFWKKYNVQRWSMDNYNV